MFQVTGVGKVASSEVRDNISCIEKQLQKPGLENRSLEPGLTFEQNYVLKTIVDAGAESFGRMTYESTTNILCIMMYVNE